ncbi:MAG: kynureninase [Chloroflexi bacterium]|nr:kynureninase [Chloroflexota bacterium]
MDTTLERAEALDAADPLASFRDRFVIDDPDLVYLDGNSLGRLPKATAERLATAVREDWGGRLIRGWDDWLDLPVRVGDRIGTALLGARPGEVIVADSTTVNFHRLAVAALDARGGRRAIVTDRDNFPTDRYVLEGLAAARGLAVRWIDGDPVAGATAEDVAAVLDDDVALVALSHVNYRSAAIADLARISALAHESGALTLWDLCHSVGSIPVQATAGGMDLAVGCTYKYLSGGPGAPAFLYVRRELQRELRNPVQGWFGREDQFAMAQGYAAAPGIRAWLTGTAAVLGIVAVEEGVRIVADAGIEGIRAKGIALTEYAIGLHDAWLAPLGCDLGSPRDARDRGAHVSIRHPQARRLCAALIAAGIVPDFRAPDSVRLGFAPLYTRFVDVHEGLDRLRRLIAGGA